MAAPTVEQFFALCDAKVRASWSGAHGQVVLTSTELEPLYEMRTLALQLRDTEAASGFADEDAKATRSADYHIFGAFGQGTDGVGTGGCLLGMLQQVEQRALVFDVLDLCDVFWRAVRAEMRGRRLGTRD